MSRWIERILVFGAGLCIGGAAIALLPSAPQNDEAASIASNDDDRPQRRRMRRRDRTRDIAMRDLVPLDDATEADEAPPRDERTGDADGDRPRWEDMTPDERAERRRQRMEERMADAMDRVTAFADEHAWEQETLDEVLAMFEEGRKHRDELWADVEAGELTRFQAFREMSANREADTERIIELVGDEQAEALFEEIFSGPGPGFGGRGGFGGPGGRGRP